MVFDPEEYDRWYESHYELYMKEVEILRPLVERYPEPGLEVGVGTGRFATALGMGHGLDSDAKMLEFAERRGIKTRLGYAENLPYPNGYFGRVLVVTAFPFFNDPGRVVSEIHRVLMPGGGLIVGMIPRSGPFGKKYGALKNEGDERFQNAHFFAVKELISLISLLFKFKGARSLVIDEDEVQVLNEEMENAAFVAMAWEKLPEKF